MFRYEMNIAEIPRVGLVYRFTIGDYHYTGSTLETIHSRIRSHQTACKGCGDDNTRKFYKHLVENGGWGAVKVHILERDIEEHKLEQREQSYINKNDPFCLNTYNVIAPLVPAKTPVRSECRKAYDREYYEAHKEELKKKRMERYDKDISDPDKKRHLLEVGRRAQARYASKKRNNLTPAKDGVDV